MSNSQTTVAEDLYNLADRLDKLTPAQGFDQADGDLIRSLADRMGSMSFEDMYSGFLISFPEEINNG